MKNYFLKNFIKFSATIFVVVVGFFIFSPTHAFAANRYWVGTAGASTNSTTNWSSTVSSACSTNTGATVPGSGDIAIFESTCTNDATIDAPLNVAGININSGYSGTVTQSGSNTVTIGSSNYIQAGGTFTGGSGAISISGSFTFSGGTFTSTSATLGITNDFTLTNTPTFNANSGTVTFNGGSSTSSLSCANAFSSFNLVTFSKTGLGPGVITVGANCTVPLGNSATSNVGGITNNGTMTVGTGTWTISNPGLFAGTNYGQSTGTLIFTGTTIDSNLGSISLTGGTFTAASLTTLTIEGSLDNSGSLLPNGLNVTFDGGTLASTITCGTVTFNLVTINKGSLGPGAVTINSGCTIPLGNSPTTASGTITNNGTVNVGTGTWTISNGGLLQSGSLYTQGTGTTTFTGTTIVVSNGGMTLTGGTFTASSMTTLQITGDLNNSGNLLPNGLNFTINGTSQSSSLSCGTVTFNSVTINKNALGPGTVTINSGCTIPLGNNATTSAGTITNNGTVTVGTGTWTMNNPGNPQSLANFSSGTGTTTFTGTIIDANNGGLSLPGGTFTVSNLTTLNVEGNLDNTGNKLPNGLIYNMDGNVATTLVCGSVTFASTTINKGNSIFDNTVYPSGNCTTSGNFTRTKGVINNPGSAYSWFVGGDFSMSTTDAFGGANLTIELNGTGTQNISQNAANTFNSIFRVNKASGTAQLSTNLTGTTAACTVAAGTFDLHGHNFTCGGTFTIQNGTTLQLFGSETSTSPTLNSGSIVAFTGDGDSAVDNFTITSLATTFSNLTINSTDGTNDTFQLGNNAVVNSGFTITAGAFNQGATFNLTAGATTVSSGATFNNTGTGDLTLSGNLVNNGRMTFRGNNTCGGSDDIVISSTSGQRLWSGSGRYYFSDMSVSNMGGSATVYVGSGTNGGSNDTNWHFASCQTWTQSNYEWFDNADSVQPGTSLGGEGSAASSHGGSADIRLRLNTTINNIPIYSGDQAYKLQYAISSSGGPWQDVQSSWWSSSWLNRKKFYFDNSSSNSNLQNFPVLITLTTSNFDYSKTQSAGQDLRFIDADGTTVLNYEIEKWDSSGTSLIWVKVPQIDAASTGDGMWMYYNNSGASAGQSPTNVWDNNFTSVWHMKEANGVDPADSTINGKTATRLSSNEPAAFTSGQVDGAQDFDGNNDMLTVSSPGLPTGDFTFSQWVNLDTNNDEDVFMATDGSGGNEIQLYIGSTAQLTTNNATRITSTATITTGKWWYITVTRSGSALKMYLNDTQEANTASDGTAFTFSTCSLLIGTDADSACAGSLGNYLDGRIDEFRISNIARPADWVKAEYKTETNSFGNFGPQETLNLNNFTNTWSYENNPTPTSGSNISSTLLSDSTVSATYQEDGPTPANATDISPGSKVEWDFALSSPGNSYLGTTYYFRMVKSDGSVLDTYSLYPQLGLGNLSGGGGGATGGGSGGGTPSSGGGQSGSGSGTGGSSGGGTPSGGGGQGGSGASS